MISFFAFAMMASGVMSSRPAPLPSNVRTFVSRRERCDHFRGEDPYDAARGRFLARQMQKYCKGTDKELVRLKARHATDLKAMAVLSQYEDRIE